MDWKEFFKPTIWKIILTALFILIASSLYGVIKFYFIGLGLLGILFFPVTLIGVLIALLKITSHYVLVGYLLAIPYSYLLTCILFQLKKVKNPKVHKAILTIVLLILISYFSPCRYSGGQLIRPPQWGICKGDALYVLIPVGAVVDASWSMWGTFGIGSGFISLPIMLLISYLLATLIIRIFKK